MGSDRRRPRTQGKRTLDEGDWPILGDTVDWSLCDLALHFLADVHFLQASRETLSSQTEQGRGDSWARLPRR